MKKNQKMRMIRYGVLGVLCAGVVIAVIGYSVRPKTVRVARVQQKDVIETVTGDGTLISNDSTVYYANVTAPIAQMKLKTGDIVSQGELLIAYDAADLEKDYRKMTLEKAITEASQNAILEDNAKLNQKIAEAGTKYEEACIYEAFFQSAVDQMEDALYNISLVEQQLDDLKADVERQQAVLTHELQDPDADEDDIEDANDVLLQKQMAYNDKEKELAKYDKASVEECMADCQQELTHWKEEKERQRTKKEADDNTLTGSGIQETAAVKENVEFDVEKAQEELEKGQQGIVAKEDGVVTSLLVHEGETVADGTELFTIENQKDVCVRADFSKYDMDKVAMGQLADVTLGNYQYEGVVTRIDRKAATDNANKPKVFVEVTLQNVDDHVFLGLEADVTIYTDSATAVNTVPFEAVYEQDGGSFVYLLQEGRIQKQAVITGLSDGVDVEILEGLNQESCVILNAVTDEDIGTKVKEGKR